ncbi:MAG: enoyl-CoA hydratase/isomerase family protein [Planctomycetes bacterium]|nr:enoyl-CoA hydratase/isomerase family protein [Planctomycetota bacterium]
MSAYEYQSIIFTNQGGVARITLNRPPLNVMNIPMIREINSALKSLESEKDVKLLVIDHRGKAFSAGVDIKDHTGDKVEEMIEVFHGMFRLLTSLEPPTLAAVNGAALGGGCELAACCDLAIASAQSTFGQPEIKVGVFPPIAAVFYPPLIARHRTLELLLTGEVVGAAEAEKLGLINKVFPTESFQEQAEGFVARLAASSAPVLRLTKKAVDQGMHVSFAEGISRVEKIFLDELMRTDDAGEGLRAFLEKRKPVWKNK